MAAAPLFFAGMVHTMSGVVNEKDLLSEVERALRESFDKGEADKRRVPSSAHAAPGSNRLDQLVLPVDQRAKMPATKDKYLVKENPQLVAWERETRKFLRNLSVKHGHRVSAVMIYEWATGINIAALTLTLAQEYWAGTLNP
jgi:hypothetical protein